MRGMRATISSGTPSHAKYMQGVMNIWHRGHMESMFGRFPPITSIARSVSSAYGFLHLRTYLHLSCSVADYHERLEERHYPHRDSPMWQGEDAYHVRGDGQPHMKFGMIYDVDGEDDKLLRGELLALLRLMIGRSNLKAFVDHMVIPVSIFPVSSS